MNKFSYFKIGIFVISAIVIGVIGVIAFGLGSIFETKTLVETYIDESVQGLDVGSPFKFRGVPVGKVEQITLTNAAYRTQRSYVLVRMSVTSKIYPFRMVDSGDPQFRNEIERGLRVRLAQQGLTGVAYIEADYQDPLRNPALEIDWQPRYPYVPSVRSRITELSEAVERILRNFEQINLPDLTKNLGTSLQALTKVAQSANLDKISNQASLLLGELRATNRQIATVVSNPELKSAIADASATAAGARQMIERAQEPVNRVLTDLPRASENLANLTKRIDAVSADLPETSAQLRQTLQNLNRLISSQQQAISAAVENLRAASQNMRELTENASKYPSQTIFGAPPPPSKVMPR